MMLKFANNGRGFNWQGNKKRQQKAEKDDFVIYSDKRHVIKIRYTFTSNCCPIPNRPRKPTLVETSLSLFLIFLSFLLLYIISIRIRIFLFHGILGEILDLIKVSIFCDFNGKRRSEADLFLFQSLSQFLRRRRRRMQSRGSNNRLSRMASRSRISTVMLSMIATMATIYVAGR